MGNLSVELICGGGERAGDGEEDVVNFNYERARR
jgi:hypothetical protein